jgi:hypothetical protein
MRVRDHALPTVTSERRSQDCHTTKTTGGKTETGV